MRQLAIILIVASTAIAGHTATTTFSYSLPISQNTSAAVFDTNGTLIRTLWSGVAMPAGTNIGTWDGLKDDGTAADPAATYTFKVVGNNIQYKWLGVIGNSSNSFTTTANHIWRSVFGLHDMTFDPNG